MRKTIALTAACVTMMAILSCNNPASVGTQAYSFQCSNFDQTDEVLVHISYPSGGEAFHVGQTVNLSLCYEDTNGALGGEELLLEKSSGLRLEITDFSSETDAAIAENIRKGIFSWTIPDSLMGFDERGDKIPVSTLGDSCRIRFQGYGESSDLDFSYSGWFSISK